ncbi:isochorismate synthase [Halomonas faecis]|uniref:isochorismate synthase n=1 Tax=Halomonas faecis TaxID=1562110 RepID=UPI0013D7A387|nr:isochorismate synthase [Halomonas faecis]
MGSSEAKDSLETETIPTSEEDERQLLFASTYRELKAFAPLKPLTLPPHAGDKTDSAFQLGIREALEEARRAGQANPIVVGAIPFDEYAPSCLYVPHRYEWRARDVPKRRAGTAKALPRLLDQRSLPDERGFKRAVEQAIVNFGFGDIRKAVLSVMHELHFSAPLDVDRLLEGLGAHNPEGYRFRIPLADGADLIGVSPELLLGKEAERVVSNPLAGTARRLSSPVLDREAAERLLQSTKDRYEHRLVVDDVLQALEPHCTELTGPERPSLLATTALWHLSTRIEGQLRDPDVTSLQLACRLHPTPAVCGYPTQGARRLIGLIEPFERGLFTGMVGWCDMAGNGEWVVTIRCGTVKQNVVRLFAGAGIVEGSQPDAEWAEVQAKLGTMLRVCGIPAEERSPHIATEIPS